MTLVSENSEEIVFTEEQSELLDFLRNGRGSCFITGNAGTGKSTTVNKYLAEEREANSQDEHADIMGERIAVLAPTGIAALNIGGATIHSFFTIPPELLSTWDAQNYLSNSTQERLAFVKTILIDEISMVRADVFAVLNRMLQLARDSDKPFGGVRMILVGDIMQLPPVVRTKEESQAMADLGSPNGWFFKTQAYDDLAPKVFQLTQSFRQRDPKFYSMLNRVRAGDRKVPFELNAAVKKAHQAPRGTLQLSCTNSNVDMINESEFKRLPGEKATYQGTLIDKFPVKNVPVPVELNVGIGARVMTVKNGGGYVNGSIGTVVGLEDTSITVKLDSGITVTVVEAVWQSIKYQGSGKGLMKVVEGQYKQIPVKLAWAITIHKSQGQSLDSAVVDFGNRTFAHGQAYVALSRLRSLEGMYFSRPMKPKDIIIDDEVLEFLEANGKVVTTRVAQAGDAAVNAAKKRRTIIARAED